MNKKPRPSSQEILTPSLLLRYSTSGLYIGLATVGVYASYFTDRVSFQDLSAWSTCKDTPLCSIYTDLRPPQTLALTTLVTTTLPGWQDVRRLNVLVVVGYRCVGGGVHNMCYKNTVKNTKKRKTRE